MTNPCNQNQNLIQNSQDALQALEALNRAGYTVDRVNVSAFIWDITVKDPVQVHRGGVRFVEYEPVKIHSVWDTLQFILARS